jgi:hypothetical protein
MAFELDTANNLEDLFGRLISFVSTNQDLVDAGQAWQVLRQHRDNIAVLTTNLNEPTSAVHRKTIHTCRYDPRSLNTNSVDANKEANFAASNYASGTSHVTWQMRTARTVETVRLRAPRYSGDLQYMLRNFRLQYSDNDSTWTTALTVNSNPSYSLGETKDFIVPGSPGSHLYWRILMDSVQGGSTSSVAWMCMLLLEADGTVANHFGSEAILKGVGMSGTDEIFVGVRSEYDAASGWYNLFMNGYTGYDANEQSWFNQPGALNGPAAQYPMAVPMVPCWNTLMPYLFVATGRSFRFMVKVSTSYEGGYAGFFLPYATPQQYPYPLTVGGSLVPVNASRSSEWRYSAVDARHGVYPGPGASNVPNSEGLWATLYTRSPDGEWIYFANRPGSAGATESILGPTQSSSSPYTPSGGWRSVWPHCMNDQWTTGKRAYRECLGGGYMLQPCILMQRAPYTAVFGELEGTYIISGYQNAPENGTVYDGKYFLITQNAYRSTVHEFWALSID